MCRGRNVGLAGSMKLADDYAMLWYGEIPGLHGWVLTMALLFLTSKDITSRPQRSITINSETCVRMELGMSNDPINIQT